MKRYLFIFLLVGLGACEKQNQTEVQKFEVTYGKWNYPNGYIYEPDKGAMIYVYNNLDIIGKGATLDESGNVLISGKYIKYNQSFTVDGYGYCEFELSKGEYAIAIQSANHLKNGKKSWNAINTSVPSIVRVPTKIKFDD